MRGEPSVRFPNIVVEANFLGIVNTARKLDCPEEIVGYLTQLRLSKKDMIILFYLARLTPKRQYKNKGDFITDFAEQTIRTPKVVVG